MSLPAGLISQKNIYSYIDKQVDKIIYEEMKNPELIKEINSIKLASKKISKSEFNQQKQLLVDRILNKIQDTVAKDLIVSSSLSEPFSSTFYTSRIVEKVQVQFK